jgi:type II secretory pathway component PulF
VKKFTARIEIRRKIVKKTIEAENIQRAQQIAKTQGKVISIVKSGGLFSFDIPMDQGERQMFLQRLSAMLASKVGTGDALSLMETTFTGPIKSVSGRMLKFVENGDSIGTSMLKIGSPNFTPQIIALVQAGERGGNTAKALRNAADFEMEMSQIKRGGGFAIWSGVGGLFSALGIFLGTKYYFAPQILESDFMLRFWDAIGPSVEKFELLTDVSMIALYIVLIFMVKIYIISTFGRLVLPTAADRYIARIPIIKDLVLAKNNYTALFGLSMLVDSGVSMESALDISAKSTKKGQMRDDFTAAVKAVRTGNPWAKAMKGLHPTDKAALSTSEDRLQIAKSLHAIADQYKSIFASRIAITAPILQGLAGIFLLLSAASMFGLTILPMLQISASGLS